MIGLMFLMLSCAVVGAGLWLGGEPSAYWSGGSALLVVVGTFTLTGVSLQSGDRAPLLASLAKLFHGDHEDPRPLARYLLDLAARVRREGVPVLESARVALKGKPFLSRALGLVADGLPPDTVEALLRAEIEAEGRRRARLAELLRRGAEIAPALGLIGTLIGLVKLMGSLNDPSKIGPAMAIALLTTLYGALLAHVLLLPLAARAEAQADAEQSTLLLIASGVAALGRGEHPLHLESKLNALLPPAQRVEAA